MGRPFRYVNIANGYLKCSKCELEKEPDAFYSRKNTLHKKHSWCKQCISAHATQKLKVDPAYALKMRERCAAHRRKKDDPGSLPTRFRIKTADYHFMRDEQENACFLCKKSAAANKKRLAIDHDHTHCPDRKGCPNCIRGLLCEWCNRVLIPTIERLNVLTLTRVQEYLKRRPLAKAPAATIKFTNEQENEKSERLLPHATEILEG